MADGPVIITGAGGQLATAMQELIPEAVALTQTDLDFVDIPGVEAALLELDPSLVLNCAAYTAVDRAEEEEELATVVNGEAVGAMARVSAELGARFVTFSTDYVFDGQADEPYMESDPTDPINAYGRSKLVGERLALAAHPGAVVIRTSWLVSATHDNFVSTMLKLVAGGRELSVVNDQVGSPTIAADLARAALAIGRGTASGIMHVTNTGATTWFDLARESLSLAGLNTSAVSACTTADYPTPAPRPAFSVLGSERRTLMGFDELPTWQESLVGVVEGQVARLDL